MAVLLVEFDEPMIAADGTRYIGRVWGEEDDIKRWVGWIDFVAGDGETVRTDTETVQPNRRDLEYWATGLTLVYLEGALNRALYAEQRGQGDEPAEFAKTRSTSNATLDPRLRPILDPFATYLQGEGILRAELSALSFDRLRSIAAAFAISSAETSANYTPDELRERILLAARQRVLQPEQGRATR